MIKLSIDIKPEDVVPNKARYDAKVIASLEEISKLVPNHKAKNFKSRLWGYFKYRIWKQQDRKCCFCEKTIPEQESELEHFRPKTETKDIDNTLVTRLSYWWLAYDCINYMVSCGTCNNQKGNRFPIDDERTRVSNGTERLAPDGRLGQEENSIINPRFQCPERSLSYSFTSEAGIPLAHVKDQDKKGENSINVYDLNRQRVNKTKFRDNLPCKRGLVLGDLKNELKTYEKQLEDLDHYVAVQYREPDIDLADCITRLQSKIKKRVENIYSRFFSVSSEFSGMCKFWLKNETDLEDDFIRAGAR